MKRKAYLFLTPSFVGVVLFVLVPFLDVIRRSFWNAMGTKFMGLQNYITVFQNEAFQRAVWNTARFLFTCIPLLMLVSLLCALGVESIQKVRELLKTTFLFPMAIPIASVVLFWKLVFDNHGWLNQIMGCFHLESVDWMNTPAAFHVLVFSYLWKNTGYFMVLWITGLHSIPESVCEAAKVDGAGVWYRFRYVTLPGLRSTSFAVFILALVNSFKVFREACLIAGNYPHESIYMLQHLFNNWFVNLDIQKMSAASVLTAAVMAVILAITQAVNRKEG